MAAYCPQDTAPSSAGPLAPIPSSSKHSPTHRASLKAHHAHLLTTEEQLHRYEWEGKEMCRGSVNAGGLHSVRPGSVGRLLASWCPLSPHGERERLGSVVRAQPWQSRQTGIKPRAR